MTTSKKKIKIKNRIAHWGGGGRGRRGGRGGEPQEILYSTNATKQAQTCLQVAPTGPGEST